jgi:hypothetical protein
MDIHDNAKKNMDNFFVQRLLFYFFNMSILGGISKNNHHLLMIDGIVHILP